MRLGGHGAWLALGAALVCVTACDQLFGIDERAPLSADAGDATAGEDAPGADAPTADTSSVDAAGADADASIAVDSAAGDAMTDGTTEDVTGETASDGASDAPGTDAHGCSGPTLYVSMKGSDSNPGCDPAHPKATLASAIAAASAPDAGLTTIEVCAGSYAEDSLTLGTNVSLLGGYDCQSTPWTRTATYGYPTFDKTNQTILAVATSSASGATLLVSGPTATGKVDGFTIDGQVSGSLASTSAAVWITGGAAPTLSNDLLVGGGTAYTGTGSDPTPASAGVVLDNSASAVLTMDSIQGGAGITSAGASTGSAGVYTTGANGALTMTECTVYGGSGRTTGASGTGSQGLLLTGTAAGVTYSVASSSILGGKGSNTACSNCRATRGVELTGGSATLDLTSNAIEGGDVVGNPNGATTGSDCPRGVEAVLVTGLVTATGNRIYGGQCNLTSPASGTSLYGFFAGTGVTLVATNNMIHMGTSTIPHGGAALAVSNVNAPRLVHNTLIAGPTAGGIVGALWIQTGTTAAVVTNNVLADSGNAAPASGLLLSCPADAGPFILASFQDNLLFGAPAGLMQWSNCNGNASYATVDAMTAELDAMQSGLASGNVTVNASCGTDSGCVLTPACTGQAPCLANIFSGFDATTLGYSNLFPAQLFAGTCPTATAPPAANGWPLAATPPCLVAKSPMNDSTTVTKDLYGNCRSTATMGAAEYVGACR